MTQKSYFWNHGTGSDASYSPYDAIEFNQFHFMPSLIDEKTAAYVIPDYLNSLWVRSAGAGTHAIEVKSGAACFNNYMFISDTSVTLPITRPTAGSSRIDLVVLRYVFTGGKPSIRIAIIEGGSAAYPSEPTVTQAAAIWEVALASIYVDGDITYIEDANIIDKRKFIYTDYIREKYGTPDNLLRNSEWFSVFTSAGTQTPSAWGEYATNFYCDGAVAVTLGSGRGNLAIDAATGVGGICQWVRGGSAKVYTLRGTLFNVEEYFSIGIRGFRENGNESSVSKKITFYTCPAASTCTRDLEYQFTIEFPEDDIQDLLVYTESYSFDTIADIGQMILVPGYFPGNYRNNTEIILTNYEITDAAWDGDAKSTGTTTIDFGSDFSGEIPDYTQNIIMRIRARDSGSAAGAPYLRVLGYAAPYDTIYGTVRLEGVFNDSWRETQVIIPTNQLYWKTGVGGGRMRIEVSASGAGTLDAFAEIVGVVV